MARRQLFATEEKYPTAHLRPVFLAGHLYSYTNLNILYTISFETQPSLKQYIYMARNKKINSNSPSNPNPTRTFERSENWRPPPQGWTRISSSPPHDDKQLPPTPIQCSWRPYNRSKIKYKTKKEAIRPWPVQLAIIIGTHLFFGSPRYVVLEVACAIPFGSAGIKRAKCLRSLVATSLFEPGPALGAVEAVTATGDANTRSSTAISAPAMFLGEGAVATPPPQSEARGPPFRTNILQVLFYYHLTRLASFSASETYSSSRCWW